MSYNKIYWEQTHGRIYEYDPINDIGRLEYEGMKYEPNQTSSFVFNSN